MSLCVARVRVLCEFECVFVCACVRDLCVFACVVVLLCVCVGVRCCVRECV